MPSSLPTPSADVRWDHFNVMGMSQGPVHWFPLLVPNVPNHPFKTLTQQWVPDAQKCQGVWSASARKWTCCQQDNWCLAEGMGCWIINEGIITITRAAITMHRPTVQLLWLPRWLSGRESTCQAGDVGLIPGWEDPPEEEMATRSIILAQEISWREEPGGL